MENGASGGKAMQVLNPVSQLTGLFSSMNPFLLLLVAIATEIVGTTALRVSAGFTKFWPSVLVAISYVLSFYLYAQVLKQIPMGVAYAIWAGLGTVGVVAIGALVWGDQLNIWQIVGMVMVVGGAVILNAFTPTGG
jgi:small multidrug resistance pump